MRVLEMGERLNCRLNILSELLTARLVVSLSNKLLRAVAEVLDGKLGVASVSKQFEQRLYESMRWLWVSR